MKKIDLLKQAEYIPDSYIISKLESYMETLQEDNKVLYDLQTIVKDLKDKEYKGLELLAMIDEYILSFDKD